MTWNELGSLFCIWALFIVAGILALFIFDVLIVGRDRK